MTGKENKVIQMIPAFLPTSAISLPIISCRLAAVKVNYYCAIQWEN